MLLVLRLVSVLYSNNVSLMLSPPERMTLDKQTKKSSKNPERKNMESKISPCWFCTLHCVLVNVCIELMMIEIIDKKYKGSFHIL